MRSINKGQSLTEILVALAIGVAFINVGILAMSTANVASRVNKANNFALSLLKSQRNVIETLAENDWHSIADLTIGKHYKLAKQNNTWVVQPGEDKAFDEKPPVAQWNFDEGAGTLAYDNVGTNNGTINGATWQTSPSNCVSGTCLGFDTSALKYIGVPDNDITDIRTNLTLEAWIYPTGVGGSEWVSTILASMGYGYYLSFTDSNNSLACYWYGKSPEGYHYTGDNTIRLNQWNHVVCDWDATTLRQYINGELSKTTSVTGDGTGATFTYIGAEGDTRQFQGSIDDVRIYDYALSDSQVKQHYNAGLNRLGLVAQWGMDEGSGTTAYDSQGGNNGTLTNGPTWQTSTNCVSGGCLGFDGVDDYVLNAGYTHSASAISLAAWFKTNKSTNSGIVGIKYSPLLLISGGRIYFYDGGTLTSPATPLYNDNVWHYVVGTHDGTTGNIYVDGKLVATNVISITYPYQGIYIGDNPNNANLFFGGSIDDVRLYNRALSADEIANQYKDGYTKYFYVNNVSRDIASDPTASTHDLETTYNANHDDPNTKKIINVTRYLLGTPGRVNTQEQYLTRAFNVNSLIQTDWSGSSGVTGPEIDFGNNYYNSSNLTLSTAGQMSLTSAASNGTLTSTIIDTQSINGAGYFNILWQGSSLCTGCSVKFQIAASNSSAGPWTYYGPTSSSDYYIPSGPGVVVPITYAGLYSAGAASVQNKRYIRYQITLVPASSVSPVVNDVIINYSP